jgi:hypothetical protein
MVLNPSRLIIPPWNVGQFFKPCLFIFFLCTFLCVHYALNIELVSCPCLCFKNQNSNWFKIWIQGCACDFVILKFVCDFVTLEFVCDSIILCVNFWMLTELESIDPNLEIRLFLKNLNGIKIETSSQFQVQIFFERIVIVLNS